MPDQKLDETTRVKKVYRKVFRKRPFFGLIQIRLVAFLAVQIGRAHV